MIKKIKLANWKSHKSLELEFKPGVNMIIGRMGAGKSSILQAITYGLFGTFSELKGKDVRLSDLITYGSGAKSAQVELELSFGNKTFRIKRLINENKSSLLILYKNVSRNRIHKNPKKSLTLF